MKHSIYQFSVLLIFLLAFNTCTKTDAYGDPPLYHATLAGHREIVEILVHHEAEIDEVIEEGTPLSLAVYRGHAGVVETLIKMGANVNLKMKNDETVLHHATEMGDRAFIGLLIHAGAEVNACTAYDVTPLHIAAVYVHREAVDELIDKGAAYGLCVRRTVAGSHLGLLHFQANTPLPILIYLSTGKNFFSVQTDLLKKMVSPQETATSGWSNEKGHVGVNLKIWARLSILENRNLM